MVLVVADDLGWRDHSVKGSTVYETPRIDSLATNRARFTQGDASCQVCCPSRASLITGQFPPVYRHEFPPKRVTKAEVLKGEGYATFSAGKWNPAG